MLYRFISKFKKPDWKKGGGELIGFAICLPMMMLVICGIIMILQLGLAKQSLEYAVYTAARAAVVQEDMGAARSAATAMADSALRSGTIGVENVTIELELVAGRTDVGTDDVAWQKGALIKCIVYVDVKTIAPFANRRMGSEIIMMVEFPANQPITVT